MNLLTELQEGLAISWAAVRANKLRSVLTTLGIVIGIVTVTLMGTAIEGLNGAFLRTISHIGADVFFVQRQDWSGPDTEEQWRKIQKRPRLTIEQASALERDLVTARAVAPLAFDQRLIKYGKRGATAVTIIGSTEQLLLTGGISISDGRFLSAADAQGGRPVCVIGSTVATNLFERESPLGRKITIGDRPFEVVGVLEKQGDMFGQFDNQAIIPLRQFTAAFQHTREVELIEVKVRNVAELESAQEELHSVMRRLRRLAPGDPDDFAINQQEQILKMVHKITAIIGGIGLFITGLSLFVGGIGIMNIMFVRDRHPQSHRRQTAHHPPAIPGRGRHHLPHRRGHRARHRLAADVDLAAIHAGDPLPRRGQPRPAGIAGHGGVIGLCPRLARRADEPGGCAEE